MPTGSEEDRPIPHAGRFITKAPQRPVPTQTQQSLDASKVSMSADQFKAELDKRIRARRLAEEAKQKDVLLIGKQVADRIADLEARLSGLPFRIDHLVWDKKRFVGLGYDRLGDGWALYYHGVTLRPLPIDYDIAQVHADHIECRPLREVSLTKKASVIVLIDQLIDGMRKEHASRLKMFAEASAALDNAIAKLNRVEQGEE